MAWCTSTPSRTPPTSEGGRLAPAMGWARGCGGWLGTGGRVPQPPPDPLHRLCARQEHGAGPAVPRPAGVHRRHEFPHGFDHQRAHVRRRAPPRGWAPWGQHWGTWLCLWHLVLVQLPRLSWLMVTMQGVGGPRVQSRVPSSWWAPAFRGWIFSLLSPKLMPPPCLGQQILLLPPAAVPELQVPDARPAQRDEGAGGPEEGAPPRLLQHPQGTAGAWRWPWLGQGAPGGSRG